MDVRETIFFAPLLLAPFSYNYLILIVYFGSKT